MPSLSEPRVVAAAVCGIWLAVDERTTSCKSRQCFPSGHYLRNQPVPEDERDRGGLLPVSAPFRQNDDQALFPVPCDGCRVHPDGEVDAIGESQGNGQGGLLQAAVPAPLLFECCPAGPVAELQVPVPCNLPADLSQFCLLYTSDAADE